jgi:hypothetical protein
MEKNTGSLLGRSFCNHCKIDKLLQTGFAIIAKLTDCLEGQQAHYRKFTDEKGRGSCSEEPLLRRIGNLPCGPRNSYWLCTEVYRESDEDDTPYWFHNDPHTSLHFRMILHVIVTGRKYEELWHSDQFICENLD